MFHLLLKALADEGIFSCNNVLFMRRFLCDDFTAFIPSKFGTFPYKYFTSSDARYELPGIVSTAFGLLLGLPLCVS